MASAGPVTSVCSLCKSMNRNQAVDKLTGLQSANGFIFALLFVAFGYDGRDAAASCAVSVHCHGVVTFACSR